MRGNIAEVDSAIKFYVDMSLQYYQDHIATGCALSAAFL